MKKVGIALLAILILVVVAGGIGYAINGNLNVPEWFDKSAQKSDACKNITNWSITFGEGNRKLTITDKTKELVLDNIDNDGNGGGLISFERGNVIEFSAEFRAINEFAPPVNSKSYYMGLRSDLYPNQIEWDIQSVNQGFYSNPYGVLTEAEKISLKAAYDEVNKPQLIGTWRFVVTFMTDEVYQKNINNEFTEFNQVTTVANIVPVYVRGV